MPDRVKEKLVELVATAMKKCDEGCRDRDCDGCECIHMCDYYAESIANQLIANGVTFDKDNNVPTKLTELPNPTLEEMELSVRGYNVLRRAGMKTALDVAKLDYTQLIRLRNLGRKTYDEIVGKLEALGYNTEKMKPEVEL